MALAVSKRLNAYSKHSEHHGGGGLSPLAGKANQTARAMPFRTLAASDTARVVNDS